MRTDARDRAHTLVNAGTGFGVLISGPVALVLLDQWRLAWTGFAIVAALVTVWVYWAVPAGVPTPSSGSGRRTTGQERDHSDYTLPPGAARLLAASFLMGLSSIAVWNFGRDLLANQAGATTLSSALTWTILGASGILGTLGGDLARRVGLAASWVALMPAMGAATALFALAPATDAVVFTAAALFGASYIGLTGLVLLWSASLFPDRTSYGVGLSFFVIAAGQALGAPLVGLLIESSGATVVFYAWAGLAVLGAALGPSPRPQCIAPDQ